MDVPFCFLRGDKIPQAVTRGKCSRKKIGGWTPTAVRKFASAESRPYDFIETALNV
jgi:hypothetical protein